MKLRLLLFMFLMSGGFLYAQEVINTLIISEVNMYRADASYVELTNVGTKAVDLQNFELGRISPWDNPFPWTAENEFGGQFIRLPKKLLQPGESYVIAAVLDFMEKMHRIDPDHYGRRVTQKEMWDLADLKLHAAEPTGTELDSITPGWQVMEAWGGRDCFYLEQHLSDGDSVVVDQVGGVFDNADGRNDDKAYDVAGVTGATGNSILVRKFNVKKGNLNFADARGIDVEDSEWIPIPLPFNDMHPNRAPYWTVGNHGDYNLDANRLVSDKVQVDIANKKINAAWGTRNFDEFMHAFEQKPGIGWQYNLSLAREDSAYASARTGDKITIYVAGNDADIVTFDITVAPPTAGANLVIPKYNTNANGFYSKNVALGLFDVFEVTVDAHVMDSITYDFFGIGYATRVDTLFKFLEKAPKASWEIVWVDGTPRNDVKNGDILKVTAENGNVKEYYIKVNSLRYNHNADLAAITWPDMPADLKAIGYLSGWKGDTIPGFAPNVYNYKLEIPADAADIPALIAKPVQLNSTVKVTRAASLQGNAEQRTITFTVTAQDGYTKKDYKVVIQKAKLPTDIQPFHADPFLSELVMRDQWANGFIEIANPGNQRLDLSNYMFSFTGSADPSTVITQFSGVDDWMARYAKYVPGYKWVNQSNWAVNPGFLEYDSNVDPFVHPGDVFVMGEINSTGISGYPWFASLACDIIFNTQYNPWKEEVGSQTPAEEWLNGNFYIFKILNDSIKNGLKAANDPNDFELIEVFGMGGGDAVVGGVAMDQTSSYQRKPEYYMGKTNFQESFGTNSEDSEWIMKNRSWWNNHDVGWPNDILYDAIDLGQHFMYEVTSYKSTVTSTVYLVSEGYSMKETIKGIKAGTTVATFMGNLIKADEDQTLKVHSMTNGMELGAADMVSLNDTLIVMSADSKNISKYILNVTAEGLSSDAVLTSAKYTIEVNGETGAIKGFEYGTAIKTVLANITVPAGAHLTTINGEGAYVSMQQLNFDSTFVNVTVSDNTYFSVLAQDGITSIVYQLMPDATDNDAFVTSIVYDVVQKDVLIKFVPRGTSVSTLLGNLIPSAGASMKLVDKMGHERLNGGIADDDRVIVTSPNEMKTTVYFLEMLATQYIKKATYLAYILSNAYVVDQEAFTVNEVSGSETIAEFYSRITPAMGATAVVVDKDGIEKTSGGINGSDMVKVTSADGKIVVMYKFGPIVSAKTIETSGIQLYPNPTTGKINISGVASGNRIQVFNSVGSAIRDLKVANSIETISLDREPAGMYMIVVTNNNQMLGRFKAIKK